MQRFEAIVFDLGGVLVDWNPRYLYRKLIADEKVMEDFLTRVCHSEWNSRQDEGRLFSEGIAKLVQEFPEHDTLIHAYFDRWEEMMAGPIHGTVAILEELHRHKEQRLFALSNWSAETFPIARRRFEFFNHFHAILVSGEEKIMKPEAQFFGLLQSRHGVVPSNSIFIDDLEKNIAAAKSLGFVAIHFQNPEQLRVDLRHLGIFLEN